MAMGYTETTREYMFPNIQKVAYTATSAPSTAIAASEVYLYATTLCYINLDATATTSHMPIPAGIPIHIRIQAGDIIHVIQDAAAGNLFIVPVK